MFSKESIESQVKQAIPDCQVRVSDMTGTGDHFEIHVVSDSFEGQNLVQRHRRMHDIMSEAMSQGLHAVKYRTQTLKEAQA